MCWVTMPTRSAVEAIGSSVGGSPIVATSITPPLACPHAAPVAGNNAATSDTAIFIECLMLVPLLLHYYVIYDLVMDHYLIDISFRQADAGCSFEPANVMKEPAKRRSDFAKD